MSDVLNNLLSMDVTYFPGYMLSGTQYFILQLEQSDIYQAFVRAFTRKCVGKCALTHTRAQTYTVFNFPTLAI